MQVDEVGTTCCQLAGSRHASVDVGARPPAGRDDPRQHHLLVADDEPPFHPSFLGALTHEHTVGPAADQQLDGLDEQRLAGTRLARERRHARREDKAQVVDHPEVPHRQLSQHRPGPYRSARPNLVLTMLKKSRRSKLTKRAEYGAAELTTASPRCIVPNSRPSTVSTAGRSSMSSMRMLSVSSRTRLRSKSMWADTGVRMSARCRGDTIGPRTENAYAVEPVGVATISPSAA